MRFILDIGSGLTQSEGDSSVSDSSPRDLVFGAIKRASQKKPRVSEGLGGGAKCALGLGHESSALVIQTAPAATLFQDKPSHGRGGSEIGLNSRCCRRTPVFAQ
jgi:hypothetical protein